MVVGDLTPTFPEKIRQRGATYFVSDAVDIREKSPQEILAHVRGSREYAARLTIVNASQSLVRDLDRETLEMLLS